jgi:hypothetical protein
MKAPAWHVCVVVPACNEQDLLPRCLFSIKAAASLLACIATVDIVLAVDQSTDRTRTLGNGILGDGRGIVVCTDAGIVGRARFVATRIALRRYQGPLNRCWLANTDADSVVPSTWLRDQLDLANRGIEAIAGTVEVDSFCEHGPLAESRFRRSYCIQPDGSHTHVHGANLGVRADLYLRAGGWNHIATAEDHDLWNRLGQIGAKRISVNHVCVITSGRRVGRAPHGFADTLAAHNWISP